MNPIRYSLIRNVPTKSIKSTVTKPKLPLTLDKDLFAKSFNLDTRVSEILQNYRQMDLVDYNSLPKIDKNLLRVAAKKIPKEQFDGGLIENANVDDVIYFSKNIRQNLDVKYGKDRYVFCSIGQSPALFANVLEGLGLDSKICRYSERANRHRFYFAGSKYQKTYEEYKDYLAKMDLTLLII